MYLEEGEKRCGKETEGINDIVSARQTGGEADGAEEG